MYAVFFNGSFTDKLRVEEVELSMWHDQKKRNQGNQTVYKEIQRQIFLKGCSIGSTELAFDTMLFRQLSVIDCIPWL